MSLIEEEGEQQVRMAYLSIVGSHSVNGVSELHTKLLESGLVHDFYEMWPKKFNNKTNGVTQRRWLYKSNPSLRELINKKIGTNWVTHLDDLKKLEQFATDEEFQNDWRKAKLNAKKVFSEKIKQWEGFIISTDKLFDVHVKRIHEYKRQLLKVLHCIDLYQRIKEGKTTDFVPRTIMFAGKAAPGYYMAKLVIKFINNVAGVINNDPDTKGLLDMYFLPNYRVSLAEYVIPAADLSEQISTAGTEASGTGNMKFSLNGALTVGTMDGANIEICEQVGSDNIFIFGLLANEIEDLRRKGYNPWDYYSRNLSLKKVMDLISSGYFSPEEPHLFMPLFDSILKHGDRYLVMADYDSYVNCQEKIETLYRNNPRKWTEMSILNVANMGKFSSDRSIQQYADEIWEVSSCDIELDNNKVK
jgi:starch phosphorylase